MEGPSIRNCPRMLMSNSLEVRANGKAVRMKRVRGNLSATGIFVEGQDLPVGVRVRIRIASSRPVELDGIIRYRDQRGIGIEFADVSDGIRKRLDQLIAELTNQGAPVC